MKRLRKTQSLNAELAHNAKIGEAVANSGNKESVFGKSTTTDAIKMERWPGHPEFVFNELGNDSTDAFDFSKPMSWTCVQPPVGRSSASSVLDETNQQYLVVLLQKKDLHQ